MANIQQSFNQMLYTGTVAAGLYAHSPTGQKQAEIRSLERQERGLNKQADIETKKAEFIENPKESSKAMDTIMRNKSVKIAEIRARRYELDPTEKAYESYIRAVEEAKIYKKDFKDRISFLTSTKSKKEVDNNG